MSNLIQNEGTAITLQEVLTMLMEECDIDDAKLSRKTGIPASTISRMRINYDANPTASTLRPIAKFFGVSISQLLGDEPLPKERIPGTHNDILFTASRIPIISWANILDWKTDENKIRGNLRDWISSERQFGEKAFALPITSSSLGLAFQKGGLLIFDPDQKPRDGDFALIKLQGDEAILFRQILIDGTDRYIKSVNPEIKGTKLLDMRHEFLGVLIETRYSFQETPESNFQKESITVVGELAIQNGKI